ncbi:MAG TPA: mechanosensitive ion channel protein MscS [Bacteroidales bacterium]|nr:mechanosensitive ion channel protein MscS [Bacteroidales bacterium]
MEKLDNIIQLLLNGLITHGPKVLYAILTLIIGLWIIKSPTKFIKKAMQVREIDESLLSFLSSLISILLKTLLIVSVIGMVGIQVTSFIAILGAAGLAVGMALSGMLQNFAGGVIILLLKPFKVGDYITAQGHSGTVNKIQIFNTILKTPDNKTVILPNGGLSTGSLVNFSEEATRRVDLLFGISYDDDIDKARSIIEKVISGNNKVLQDPSPFIGVVELADSSVNFAVRLWVESANYWDVFFFMQETIKKQFDAEGVTIPFPQQDMRVIESKSK